MSKIDRNGRIDISTSNGGSYNLQEGKILNEPIHNKKSTSSSQFGVGLFGLIALILFTVSFSHYIRTGTFIDFSFKSMIDYLATMPDVSLQFMQIDLTAYGDWGLFNFAKSIWNFLAQIFEFGITVTGLGIQALVVIWFLVSMFFI